MKTLRQGLQHIGTFRYWFAGFLLLSGVSRCLLAVASDQFAPAVIFSISFVNQVSYLCLLGGLVFCAYALHGGIRATRARCSTANSLALSRKNDLIKQRIRELILLNRMYGLLQACHAEADTYPVIGDLCKKLFPLDSGCLCIIDPAHISPKLVNFWGAPPFGNTPLIGRDANLAPDDLAGHTDALCPYQHFYPEHECLCVPISVAGEMLGFLSLCFRPHSPDDPQPSRPIEAKRIVLTRVAEHYALSLANLRLRETLRIEAIRDPLTGLYNRRYMEESLEREAYRAQRHATPIGILMLDIDHFKQVNDTYGHEVGDAVLKELGAFLQKHVRGEDIACRYGGEEFLLILPEASLEISRERAEALRVGVKNLQIKHESQVFTITISLGVAILSNHHSNVKTVLAAADKALYQAKHNGRDQTVVASA